MKCLVVCHPKGQILSAIQVLGTTESFYNHLLVHIHNRSFSVRSLVTVPLRLVYGQWIRYHTLREDVVGQ